MSGGAGGKLFPSSRSDALRSSALEQTIRRKALHKSSLVSWIHCLWFLKCSLPNTQMILKSHKYQYLAIVLPLQTVLNDWQSIDSTTVYSVIFLDVYSRLDVDAAVARIPELDARPLRVCLFSASDGFRPSIATTLSRQKNNKIDTKNGLNNPESLSQYDTVAPLFIDSTRPGGLYVDCHRKGFADQPLRNTIAPQSVQPMPVLGIYDVERRLVAYRLVPPVDAPIVGGAPYGFPNQRLAWDVEKLWEVDFKSAGWTDHPNDIRFIGSDHHLLIHHANGDVTGVTLSDSRPSISALFDSRLADRWTSSPVTSDLSPSISLTPVARDLKNWSFKEIIGRNSCDG